MRSRRYFRFWIAWCIFWTLWDSFWFLIDLGDARLGWAVFQLLNAIAMVCMGRWFWHQYRFYYPKEAVQEHVWTEDQL